MEERCLSVSWPVIRYWSPRMSRRLMPPSCWNLVPKAHALHLQINRSASWRSLQSYCQNLIRSKTLFPRQRWYPWLPNWRLYSRWWNRGCLRLGDMSDLCGSEVDITPKQEVWPIYWRSSPRKLLPRSIIDGRRSFEGSCIVAILFWKVIDRFLWGLCLWFLRDAYGLPRAASPSEFDRRSIGSLWRGYPILWCWMMVSIRMERCVQFGDWGRL